jgi:hypothetical protein
VIQLRASLLSKGLVQWDVSAEAETAEDAQKQLDDGIKRVKAVILSNGYAETSPEEGNAKAEKPVYRLKKIDRRDGRPL